MTRLGRVTEWTGFGDGDGNLSFNKSVTAVSLGTFAYAVVHALNPSWALLSFGIVVIGAGFGLKGYLGWVNRNATHATISDSLSITGDLSQMIRAARERRDFGKGIDEGDVVEDVPRPGEVRS